MPIERERLCWWCGRKLAAISHATVAAPDGAQYLVHKNCEAVTMRYLRPITAQPSDRIETDE